MPRLPLILTAVAALLAGPAVASAAPAKIRAATPVTAAGTTTVKVANPNAYVLTGRATLSAAGRTASKRVRLPRRSVTAVKLRLPAKALAALKPAGAQTAVVSLRVSRSGKRATTVRRTFTLRAASATPAPAAGSAPAPAAVAGPVAPSTSAPAAPTNRWVGRMGAEGGYDDLEFTLDNGQITFTKAPAVPVFCFETPNTSNTWTSGELFDAPGPWAIGTDGAIDKQGVSVNPLVGRSPRTITYKVTGTTQQAGKITGTLGMIFYAARPDVFTGALTIVNCAGSESFEAVPAS
jgi:hypothetical protein